MHPHELGAGKLALATALLVVNGAISATLGLGLERKIAVAALRTLVQLSLLGYLLVPFFARATAPGTLALVAVMAGLAGLEAVRRAARGYRGIRLHVASALLLAGAGTSILGTGIIVGADPWWEPRYLIPLTGMVLGNALTGVTLGLDGTLRGLDEDRRRVEALLVFGATPWEAARPVAAEALRAAMIPILNTMNVVGLVTIPGMMTGQLLGGTPPAQAARYQILILFLVAAATAAGTVLAVLLAVRAVFDDQGRLRGEWIVRRSTGRGG